jgi:hypothetical protein
MIMRKKKRREGGVSSSGETGTHMCGKDASLAMIKDDGGFLNSLHPVSTSQETPKLLFRREQMRNLFLSSPISDEGTNYSITETEDRGGRRASGSGVQSDNLMQSAAVS